MWRKILSVDGQLIATGIVVLVFAVINPGLGIKESKTSFDIEPSYLSHDLVDVAVKQDDKKVAPVIVQITPLPTLISKPTTSFVASITFDVARNKEIKDIEPTPKPTETPQHFVDATDTPNAITDLIDKYAVDYNVSSTKMKTIAKCESGFRSDAASATGTYVGLYQFHPSTWISNRNAMGLDPDPSLRSNAEEAIKTAAYKMARDGYGAWPVCGKV
ncbi:transglycosylase family protein [Candidatus Woesebacteria bacterium]|nr:MAG: transglycosylase family protein [Candidatus Woesebacteria bacterium]